MSRQKTKVVLPPKPLQQQVFVLLVEIENEPPIVTTHTSHANAKEKAMKALVPWIEIGGIVDLKWRKIKDKTQQRVGIERYISDWGALTILQTTIEGATPATRKIQVWK